MCVSFHRRSSQLPPLLLQPQLPHPEPEPASPAAPAQQPRARRQGERGSTWLRLQAPEPCNVLPATSSARQNQLFCSVKNAERERRGLFGLESNATLPADWKHHEPRKDSGPFLPSFTRKERFGFYNPATF